MAVKVKVQLEFVLTSADQNDAWLVKSLQGDGAHRLLNKVRAIGLSYGSETLRSEASLETEVIPDEQV